MNYPTWWSAALALAFFCSIWLPAFVFLRFDKEGERAGHLYLLLPLAMLSFIGGFGLLMDPFRSIQAGGITIGIFGLVGACWFVARHIRRQLEKP